MSQKDKMGEIGVDGPVAAVIRRQFPTYPESRIRQMFSDPSTALLAALVEQNASPNTSAETERNPEAEYFAQEFTVTADGPRVTDSEGNVTEPDYVDGKKVDLGYVVSEFDLRGFTEDVMVAFKGPNTTNRDIKYRAQDEPVAGIDAETRYVWLWRADSASSDPTVFVEGWT